MATSTTRRAKPETPVEIYTARDGNESVYKTNINHEPTLQKVLDAYGSESVDALADQFRSPGREVIDVHRLGVVSGSGDGAEFHREEALLALTEGITNGLAEGLVAQYGDIPSLCEEIRLQGSITLGDTLNDAEVEDRAWAGDLRDLLESVRGELDSIEQRLKDADVWAEPKHVSAGH